MASKSINRVAPTGRYLDPVRKPVELTPESSMTRRIVAALQVDPRASWQSIATVLELTERTVARRGAELIESGRVRVVGVSVEALGTIVEVTTERGAGRMAARYLAARPDVSWLHMMTGRRDLIGEVNVRDGQLADVAIDELQAVPGAREVRIRPSIGYLRLAKDWDPGVLTREEIEALAPHASAGTPDYRFEPVTEMDPVDRRLAAELATDGRLPYVELARSAGLSESTVRRRVAHLVSTGRLALRAVFDPALIGLPVTAVIQLTCRPSALAALCEAVAADPAIRNAQVVTGPSGVLLQVDLASRRALFDFLHTHPAAQLADSVESAMVLRSVKRSTVELHV